MTTQEEIEIIRVCGPNYEESDIPTYIRNRDGEESEEEKYEGEKHDYHPRPEEENN